MPERSEPESGLGRKATTGLLWSGLGTVGHNVISFGVNIVLARLLAPEQFGLLGMIMVLTGFANLLVDAGFGAALIQREEVTDRELNSVLWVNVLISALLWALFALASPAIAQFYGEPVLGPLTIVYSATFLLNALRVVQYSMFRKRLNFRPLVLIELVSAIAGASVGIALAWHGAGVWSLAARTLLAGGLGTLLLWIFSPWRPTGFIDAQAIRELWRFSSNLVSFRMINYWLRQGDDLLIGRFVGATPLGLYNRAYFFLLMPLSLVSSAIGNVLFPAMSAIQHDREGVAALYRKSVRGVSVISFPLMIGLAVVADSFVLALLGEAWMDIVPILHVFALVGLAQSVGTLNGNIYMSQGRTDLQFRVSLGLGVFWIAAIVVGLQWGLMGVVYAYSLYSLLAFVPTIYFAVSLIGLSVWDVVQDILGSLICSTLMGVGVVAIGTLLPDEWPSWLTLVAKVGFGVVFYALMIQLASLQGYLEIRRALVKFMRERKPA